MTAALKNSNKTVAIRAAAALGKIGKAATSAVPVLTEMLGDDDYLYYHGVAEALGLIGSSDAIPALAEALRRDSPGSTPKYVDSVEALVAIGTESIPTLTKLLNDRSSLVRIRAAYALFSIDRSNADFVLATLLQELKSPKLAEHAASVIREFGSAGHLAVPALIRATKSQKSDVGETQRQGLLGST